MLFSCLCLYLYFYLNLELHCTVIWERTQNGPATIDTHGLVARSARDRRWLLADGDGIFCAGVGETAAGSCVPFGDGTAAARRTYVSSNSETPWMLTHVTRICEEMDHDPA